MDLYLFFNVAAMVAMAAGFLHKAFVTAYNSAWLVSFFIADTRHL